MKVSVPLRGFRSLIAIAAYWKRQYDEWVSVPLRGFRSLMGKDNDSIIVSKSVVSVPLRGFRSLIRQDEIIDAAHLLFPSPYGDSVP